MVSEKKKWIRDPPKCYTCGNNYYGWVCGCTRRNEPRSQEEQSRTGNSEKKITFKNDGKKDSSKGSCTLM